MTDTILYCSEENKILFAKMKQMLYLSMNRIVADSMKEKGATYHINYGVAYPRIKEITSFFPQREDFARLLWHSDIREMKIAATMLWPPSFFTEEESEKWVHSFTQLEMVEQSCLNLFQYLPFAHQKAMQWIGEKEVLVKITGYTLIFRLLLKGDNWNKTDFLAVLEQAKQEIKSFESILIVNSIILSMKGFMRHNREYISIILDRMNDNKRIKELLLEELSLLT